MGDPAVTMGPKTRLDEAGLRELVDHAPDSIFVADSNGRYLYVNDAACRLLGYSCDEIVGTAIADMIPAKDVERLNRSRAAMLKGQTEAAEWTLRRKDGTWVPVEVNANILPNGQWQGFVRDISGRKALFDRIETERRWREAVMDTLPLGVVLFEGGAIASANHRAEELLGMNLAPGVAGAEYANRIFYADGRPVPSGELVASRVSRGETILGEELLARWPDGTQIPVLTSAAPIIDGDGRVIGGVGVFQDLSERMRLERAVQENARLLKAVFDLLPVAVWIADKSGRIVSNNPAAERIWGGARHVPPSEFGEYKAWWVDTGAPIAAEEWALARALTAGETSVGELVRIQCFDGSFKTIINSAAPLRDENGDIAGAIVVNEDITALHETQEKQRASEHLLRTVFDLLPVGVWIADRKGHITLGNPAGNRIWRGGRDVGPDLFGEYKGWWLETGQPIAPEEWAISRAIRSGETSRSELIRIQCFDGSFKTVINWAAPIRSDAGEITGAVAVNEDVSALHQSQEQLRRAVRDREELLAAVTHDLRNPLSALMLMATTAEHKARALEGGEPVRAMAESIIEITRGMSALVGDLLEIAIARPGRSILKIAPVKAATLLARAADAARPLFAREGIKLEIAPTGELPVIQVDANRVLRVFANLLDNALKFTEPHGTTVLRAEAFSAGVRFCVANSGPALSADEVKSMFQPFWQAGRDDRRGAGLGLSICRSILEAHGGSIWAEPATGKRVRICFLLPCVNPAAASVEAGQA
jgi:PAS domain S-box-containing protein